MERFTRLIFAMAGVSFLAFAAGVFLSGVDATIGWYYGVGLLFVGLGVFRTLEPTVGISLRRFKSDRGRRGKDDTHVPRPVA